MKPPINRITKYGWMLIIILSGLSPRFAKAQFEPMFTQYMYNELFINPAYAGSHENVSLNLLYRNQWVGITGAPKTQTFSAHAPINNRHLGVGFSVLNENVGVTHQIAFYGDFAYRMLFPRSVLSFGVSAGVVNDEERFTDIHTTDPGDLQFYANRNELFLPNAGFGIYFSNKKFYAGLSIPRLLQNKIDSANSNTVVRNVGNFAVWHYYLATGYVFDISHDLKLKPAIMIKAVQNAPAEVDINANLIVQKLFWFGVGYRTGDAVIAMVGLQLTKQLKLGYSYDYTLSDLQRFNSGSHEITLGFDFSFDRNRIITPRYF